MFNSTVSLLCFLNNRARVEETGRGACLDTFRKAVATVISIQAKQEEKLGSD